MIAFLLFAFGFWLVSGVIGIAMIAGFWDRSYTLLDFNDPGLIPAALCGPVCILAAIHAGWQPKHGFRTR